MRWLGGRESENVEDRRGAGGGFPVGITGGVGAIVVLVIGLFLGIDPSTLMAVLNAYAPVRLRGAGRHRGCLAAGLRRHGPQLPRPEARALFQRGAIAVRHGFVR